jgi:hypothetical protein
MASSSEGESDMEEVVYSSGDESYERKKRPMSRRLRGTRKKTRSMDGIFPLDEIVNSSNTEGDAHTGLSPRLTKMDIVAAKKSSNAQDMGVFFLDDGVETFSVDGDPRMNGVREIYNELDRRLELAAANARLPLTDPAVSNLKKHLALRAAELEAVVAEKFGGPASHNYRDSIYRVIHWIQSASETDLRDVLDGRLTNFSLEDRPSPQQYQHQMVVPPAQPQQYQLLQS